MTVAPDVRAPSTIDRTLGWLIALGGCIVILDQTVFRLSELGLWAAWWNAGAVVVVVGVVALAVGGLWLPTRVLVASWWTLPVLYVVVQAAWVYGTRGPATDAPAPWVWTVEPAIVTMLILVVRPVTAVVLSIVVSAVPALTSLLVLGTVVPAIARETPNQLGNVVYVVIFVGVRARLRRLRELEGEARSQQRRQLRAEALAEQHARLSRFVHDEVLSVLSAAMQASGPPSDVLRRAAGRGVVALDESVAADSATGERIDVAEAAALIGGTLRLIDDDLALDLDLSDGELDRGVTGAVSLAAAEALRNSVRHAGDGAARRVHVALAPDRVRVVVGDDGVGFDPAAPSSRLGITESIERRMAELGGSASIRSQPGAGTEVTLSWPT